MGLFEPRRKPASEKKGPGGQKFVGFWATTDEQTVIAQKADEHGSVAEYFRTLIRADLERGDDSA